MPDSRSSSSSPATTRHRLDGRVALVTGGGTGIGRAAALAFAREGARVVVAGRRAAPLDETVHAIAERGGEVFAMAIDVTSVDGVRALIDATIARYGALHAAFNNAGTEGTFAPIVEQTEADFDHVIATNLKGTWLSIKYEVEAMLAHGGGAIVNTSSWLAKGALAGSSTYSASKGALDALVRAVALEGGPHGIRINNVNPGIIDTPMARRFGDDEMFRPFAAFTPAQRIGTPEDVADAVVWLCSDEARFVTGESLLVDGGYTIGGMR
ncbi:SDR family NAD(P)-dependent oxidoreductase [Burkholderia sp. Se-20378]|uniref:SDR family NAD(P)-dependent oxidoreductase n=1 Tax=Burkholderia sp. Se-20378 TaxID=2703899 RepID=UPI001981180C|nr:glucose 1-dehydrogenase [Burkholderia sp. Se-20378]MBN3768479.1 glucose 1-dehydrogenase [Burkholderia sp. Se-20378]